MISLVIVDRNRPEVFERLANRFAREPKVRVIFDRRRGDATRAEDERRAAAPTWADGYLLALTPDRKKTKGESEPR